MSTDKIPFNISTLIARKLSVEITEDEQAALDSWINASPVNRAIYEKAIDPKTKAERDRFVQTINVQEDWLKVEQQLRNSGSSKQVQMFWFRIAAAVVFLAVTLGIIFSQWQRPQSPQNFAQEIARINPGKPQATITLNNGTTISLSESNNQNKSFEESNGSSMFNANGVVSYGGQSNTAELLYNEINIPRGGEYQVVLSDGTRVWLNSETQLKFPVAFVANDRVVELTGEAYFEVAHDSKRPFIVKTLESAAIKVYGTSFNINAYADNDNVAVTLSEGRVSVSKEKNDEVFLQPEQQAIITQEHIAVSNVDVSSFTGWKDGLLMFDNLSMEEIAKLLSRWYDVEFEFENDNVKQFRFSADIKRYASFGDVLHIFEKTGQLSFEVHGKTIKVLSRAGA